jgi:hypothetical protein
VYLKSINLGEAETKSAIAIAPAPPDMLLSK